MALGKKKKNKDKDALWSFLSFVAAFGAAKVASKTLNGGWKAATGKKPPANAEDPEVATWEAVAWAAASGTLMGVARMLATRKAAQYYVKSKGELPKALQPAQTKQSKKAQKQAKKNTKAAEKSSAAS